MNPLVNLIDKKFKDLTTSEMIQTVNTYFEEGKFYNLIIEDKHFNNTDEVVKHFENVCHSEYELKRFFNDWAQTATEEEEEI